ncbi:F0F1 ATP synthase subunit A [Crocinitomicaceae bacterium CZZ-1]|uniref:ATP synthase subunit a n=1 Tax=Taishania pollutisoli TaxID=2766479 RepID=A0A8J6P8X9_9FLAO|nr:F0F1 ATP synthase subunit A [Taishania pollutisoli]MBC9812331.1 F0F1 ATP synthase subunit A [Taishania pollutisoli]MBX2950308.1 F0F1 ATP synthase subunit A [Crocinitomicaceae bacterium]NGF74316.1 F0F1 ATP synthase subunit A [Fluviicola sp. SGL-29]
MRLFNKFNTLVLTVFSVLSINALYAGHDEVDGYVEKDFNIGEMIMHHIKDAHEIHLWGDAHNGTSVYLPIILMDGGLKTFSSSHLYHGELKTAVDHKTHEEIHYVAGVGPADGYAIFHEKIYKLENGELQFEDSHPHNAKPMDFSITKNVFVLFLVSFIVCLLAIGTARYYKKNGAIAPKGVAKFIEPLVIFVRDDVAKANIGEHAYKKYVPYLLTIFFFILVGNLLGLVPMLSANLTGNITITLFLAVCTLLATVLSGNKNYWHHIFATPGVPVPLLIIMIPIEVVGILTKPFALMIRLFANITAGHVIILAFIGIIFINKNAAWGALSVPMALFISVLEILVAFLQAYLFAMLSALFIGAAVEEHHH